MPTKKNPQPTRGFMRSVFHANEDGTTRQAEVPVHLDPDSAIFGIVLPTYMVEALELKSPVITANNIDGVCQQYEAISDEYSRWRLSIGAETALWIGRVVVVGDFMRQAFGVSAQVCLGVTEVFVVNDGKTLSLIEKLPDDKRGKRIDTAFLQNPILLPNTPEVRAKVESLIASIQQAADIIGGMVPLDDQQRLSYFLQIGDTWQPPTVIGTDPTQAELPLEVPAPVVPDDEEL